MKRSCKWLKKNIIPKALILAAFCLVNHPTAGAAEKQVSVAPNHEVRHKDCVGEKEVSSSRTKTTEEMISAISLKAAGKVYNSLKGEGKQCVKDRVAVVAAVPLSDLKRETEFGRLMAEYFLTDLADRGIKVRELRLGKEINILAQTGEFILTRNTGELAEPDRELDYVLVSTFSNTYDTLIVQARLVQLKDGFIKTSWRDTLPLNRELLNLFREPSKPYTIAVKEMKE